NLPERVKTTASDAADSLELGSAATGVIAEPYGLHRYVCQGLKGDVWQLSAEATAAWDRLDVSLAVLDAEGKQLARNDDLPKTTDAGLMFTLPADGAYTILVADSSIHSGGPAAVYRLSLEAAQPGFKLVTPEFL